MSEKQNRETKLELRDYLVRHIEPTLAQMCLFYRQGKLTEEVYLNLVACLTELFSDYGEKENRFLNEMWEYYGEMLPEESILEEFKEWDLLMKELWLFS